MRATSDTFAFAADPATDARARPRGGPIADLARVMAYRNDDVVDRFVVDHDADHHAAEQLFDDLKRWLWLCARSTADTRDGKDAGPELAITETQLELDEMWHTFILFTQAYVDFCFGHFGFYVHHQPTLERSKRAHLSRTEDERAAAIRERAAARRILAAHVFDVLGEEVARRWYLPDRSAQHAGPEGVPAASFHRAYEGRAPWEIGRAQSRVIELVADGRIVGDVLDLGCGTGANAAVLADAGHRVHGVDLVPRAIADARRNHRHPNLTFEVADLLQLDLARTFDTVLDSGVFHAFGDDDRPAYVEAVARHLVAGGRLHLLCFSDEEGGHGPRRIARDELHGCFPEPAWTVERIEATTYDTVSGPKPAWHATIRRG